MSLLHSIWARVKRLWLNSLLTVSAVLLLAAAVGKIVTYGLPSNLQAATVVHQATQVPQSMALMVVLVELAVAAVILLAPISRRIRCGMLFLISCCFLSYRILNWGSGPCGCYVNPALLNAATTRALELFAWGCLVYMLLGSALALLATDAPGEPQSTSLQPSS